MCADVRSSLFVFFLVRPGEDKVAGGEQGCEIANLAEDALMFEAAGIEKYTLKEPVTRG